jgi:hypothetical protein
MCARGSFLGMPNTQSARCALIWGAMAVTALARVSPAVADPAASYPQAMAAGQRRMAAKDFAGAATAFQAAATARPEDPRALSELAWASFLAGDFVAAEHAAVQATWATKDPGLRAMAFYNQGRALEALGRPGEAQDAYARSLDLRNSPEVRARLSQLATAILTARPLAGPFAKPEDFCKAPCEDVTLDVDGKVSETGEPVVDLAGNVEHVAKAPFVQVAKIVTPPRDEMAGWPVANIAFQIGASWFVLPEVGLAADGHGGGHRITVHMVGPRLVVDWSSSVGRFGHTDERAVVVCGVGASKRPSCVGPIVTERTETVDHCGKDTDCTRRPDFNVSFHCRAQLRGDVLSVSRNSAKLDNVDDGVPHGPRPDACESLPSFGKHALTF